MFPAMFPVSFRSCSRSHFGHVSSMFLPRSAGVLFRPRSETDWKSIHVGSNLAPIDAGSNTNRTPIEHQSNNARYFTGPSRVDSDHKDIVPKRFRELISLKGLLKGYYLQEVIGGKYILFPLTSKHFFLFFYKKMGLLYHLDLVFEYILL